MAGRSTIPLFIRFVTKVEHRDGTDCWFWKGAFASGRGVLSIGGRTGIQTPAYRVAYELMVGTIPEGMVLDHVVCNDGACVNPFHLEPVPHAENCRRAAALRTHCKRGHEWTPENLYVNPKTGYRACRPCRLEHSAQSNARRRLD